MEETKEIKEPQENSLLEELKNKMDNLRLKRSVSNKRYLDRHPDKRNEHNEKQRKRAVLRKLLRYIDVSDDIFYENLETIDEKILYLEALMDDPKDTKDPN
jgi:hypothetical protein